MACDGGSPVSDEKRNGWRPVRSSASASRSRARAAELGIGVHGAGPPARAALLTSSSMVRPSPTPADGWAAPGRFGIDFLICRLTW
jgi:hypothetical protein